MRLLIEDGPNRNSYPVWSNLLSAMGRTLILALISTSLYDIHLQPRLFPVAIYDNVRPEARSKRLVLIVCKNLRTLFNAV
jgi:hypothetical protein